MHCRRELSWIGDSRRKLRETQKLCCLCPLVKSTACSQTNPHLDFWNRLSCSNMNTSLNWFKEKNKNISSHCFDEVPSFHFHCGRILRWPAWLRQSVVALLRTVAYKQGMAEARRGRKDGWQRSESSEFFARVTKAVRTSPVQQSSENQSDSLLSLAVHKTFLARAFENGPIPRSSLFFLGRLHLAIQSIHHP